VVKSLNTDRTRFRHFVNMASIPGPIMAVMAKGDNLKLAYRDGHRLRLEKWTHTTLCSAIDDLDELIV